MNKTIALNLSGTVFHAEEPAYNVLSQYLRKIRDKFLNHPGGHEIVNDIESRLAELFTEHLQSGFRQVIQMQDVNIVLAEMGDPGEFEDTDPEMHEQTQWKQGKANPGLKKRLFRDADDRVLGGVCSGIAAYLVLDPIWIRLFFAVLLFGFGTGIFLYILLWILLPVAKTTAEKLQMRGEPVNLDNISRFVKEEFNQIRHKDFPTTGIQSFTRRVVDVCIEIVKGLAKVITAIFAVAAIFISALTLLALIVSAFALLFFSGLTSDNPFVFLLSQGQMLFVGLGVLLILGIPLFWLIFKSIAYLFKLPGLGLRIGYALLVLWILGFGLCTYAAVDIADNFSTSATHRAMESLPQDERNFYLLSAAPKMKKGNEVNFMGNGYRIHVNEEGSSLLYSRNVSLSIVKSTSGKTELLRVVSSRGKNDTEALALAESVYLQINQIDSALMLPSGFELGSDKWRGQDVKLIMRIPVGTTLELSPSLKNILAEETGIHWGNEGLGKVCQMREEGLHCIDCSPREQVDSENYKTLDLTGFSSIKAGGTLKVFIRQGNIYQVKISGEDQDDVVCTLKGKTLVIKQEGDISYDTEVHITLPLLTALDLSGSAKAQIRGIKSGTVELESSGSASIDFEGEPDAIHAEASGSSHMEFKGKAQSLQVSCSGAVQLMAKDFPVNKAEIQLSGASSGEVWVNDKLSASASGASELLYAGSPRLFTKETSGAGKIKSME